MRKVAEKVEHMDVDLGIKLAASSGILLVAWKVEILAAEWDIDLVA